MKTELEKEKRINLCLLKNYKNAEEKLKVLEQKYSGNTTSMKLRNLTFNVHDFRSFSGKAKIC